MFVYTIVTFLLKFLDHKIQSLILARLITQWHKDKRVVADAYPTVCTSAQQRSVLQIFDTEKNKTEKDTTHKHEQ